MTLQNLANTWDILAPDEVVFYRETLQVLLIKNTSGRRYVSINPKESRSDDPSHAEALQGYLQRRILERNWIAELYFSLDGPNVSSSAKVSIENSIDSSADIRRLGGQLYREYWSQSSHPSILEALLSAYVLALAMERPITPGKWSHFKGGTVDVVAQANFVEKSNGTFVDNFVLEDRPESEASLFTLGDGTHEFTLDTLGLARLSNGCPFTFYLEGDRKWTRKSEIFLGLVSGGLRFVKSVET